MDITDEIIDDFAELLDSGFSVDEAVQAISNGEVIDYDDFSAEFLIAYGCTPEEYARNVLDDKEWLENTPLLDIDDFDI